MTLIPQVFVSLKKLPMAACNLNTCTRHFGVILYQTRSKHSSYNIGHPSEYAIHQSMDAFGQCKCISCAVRWVCGDKPNTTRSTWSSISGIHLLDGRDILCMGQSLPQNILKTEEFSLFQNNIWIMKETYFEGWMSYNYYIVAIWFDHSKCSEMIVILVRCLNISQLA